MQTNNSNKKNKQTIEYKLKKKKRNTFEKRKKKTHNNKKKKKTTQTSQTNSLPEKQFFAIPTSMYLRPEICHSHITTFCNTIYHMCHTIPTF